MNLFYNERDEFEVMTGYKSVSDANLVVLLKNNQDKSAFTEIYNRYWPKLFLHARHMLADDDQAQDLVQDLFTWIWQNSQDLKINLSITSFLYGSVRHKVLNLIKHEKVKNLNFNGIHEHLSSGNYGIEADLNFKELTAIINNEIDMMPAKMKEIFELSRKKELSHKEIAEKLGISEQTVRKQVQRALRLLRSRLKMQIPFIILILQLIKK